VSTFGENQTNRRLISFNVSGRSFQKRFFAMSPVWVEWTKKQPIETKAVESLKEIGRRLARFPLKVDKGVSCLGGEGYAYRAAPGRSDGNHDAGGEHRRDV
jgi:hypothetical protein